MAKVTQKFIDVADYINANFGHVVSTNSFMQIKTDIVEYKKITNNQTYGTIYSAIILSDQISLVELTISVFQKNETAT